MKKENHVTAFYLEVLLLTLCLIGIVLVLTRVFAMGRIESDGARELTDAVCLAQNAAEAVSASNSAESLCVILNEENNARIADGTELIVEAGYNADRTPNAGRAPHYLLRVSWSDDCTGLAHAAITVRRGDISNAEIIFSLETAVYHKEAAA